MRALAAVGLATLAAASLAPASPDSLEDAMREAAAHAGGTVGAAAAGIESGEHASIAGGERFPMMSVYKVPIALALLFRIERGEISFDRKVAVAASDLRLGVSPIADRYPEGGVTLSVRELYEAMLVQSDNTASDLVLSLAGGPAAVTARLRALGVAGIRVDRSEGQLALDFSGISDLPPPERWSLPILRSAWDRVPPDARLRSATAWVGDPRDTATPEAMADLLALAFRGKASDAAHAADLFDLLARTDTAPHRLKGSLPAGTRVAHKSGTSGSAGDFTGAVNDVGIVDLGDGRHAALAVFVKGVRGPVPAAERAIARIARAVWDRWASPSASSPARWPR